MGFGPGHRHAISRGPTIAAAGIIAAGRAVMRRELTLLMLISGCVDTGASDDVTGPFTGTPRRYVIDRIELPTNNNEARGFGLDLNGDRTVDNQLGMVISTLGQYNDITTHGD